MNNLLKKLPIPISGLMLGLAALGNLIGTYNQSMRYVFGSCAAIIFILLLLKMIIMPAAWKEAFENPVVASIMGTFSMSMMLLSTYIKPFGASFAFFMWWGGIILHILLILAFTKKHVMSFSIKKVFPSFFIVYVGIVVASVTSPIYKMLAVGKLIFWIGFVLYLIWLPIVIYRIYKYKEIPEAVLPTITIFAAPASLCTAGYLSAFETKQPYLVIFLAILAVLMFLYVLLKLPKLLKLQFYPSYSAFTFPIVITAIAFTGLSKYFSKINLTIPGFSILQIFTLILACGLVIYVLIRYIIQLCK